MAKKRKRRNVTYKEWITKDGIIKLEGWARDGLINEQIAENIGIAEGTLYNWMKKYSEIDEALKRGKEVIDRQVENALLKRALGFSYIEITEEPMKDLTTGKIKLSVTKKVRKEVAGDTTAQIFWLKNRKPREWRDKQDIEHSGNMNINNPLKDITTEELKKLIK